MTAEVNKRPSRTGKATGRRAMLGNGDGGGCLSGGYRTLDDIRQRKQQLREQMDGQQQQVEKLWHTLVVKPSESTRGQFVQSLIANSALAIDAFLLVRKLRRNYKDAARILSFFGKKKMR
ncbi:MAG: hypothetical protein J5552_10265 [Prevotella sp.]|nr:hypothetical protein [Prevotella sp.]